LSALGVTLAHQESHRRLQVLGWRGSFVALVKRIVQDMIDDDCSDLAAKMAFYFLLALFPFLIFLGAMVGFLPFTNLWDKVLGWMMLYLPADVRRSTLATILSLTTGRAGFLSFGLLGTIWTASSGFVALMESLSVAYGVQETRGYWKRRVLGLLMLVIVSFFFITSFALMAAGHWIGREIDSRVNYGPAFLVLWEIARWVVTLGLLNLGVSLIDYVLPNVKRRWRWLTPGSATVAITLVMVTVGFNFYMRHFSVYHKAYNALLGFIVLTLWIYLTSFVLLIGAEVNSVLEGMRHPKAQA
jgi:membrane protein